MKDIVLSSAVITGVSASFFLPSLTCETGRCNYRHFFTIRSLYDALSSTLTNLKKCLISIVVFVIPSLNSFHLRRKLTFGTSPSIHHQACSTVLFTAVSSYRGICFELLVTRYSRAFSFKSIGRSLRLWMFLAIAV